jgi:hypothetical protein
MKVLIQWATATPTDWIQYDIQSVGDARRLPRKNVPTFNPVIDNTPGWIAAVNIQGVVFTGYDHIGFEMLNGTLVVTCWNDDLEDFPVGTRWGQKWTLGIPAPDPKIGGALNTVQTCTWYGEPNCQPVLLGVPNVHPYSELTFPPNNQTLHGVWVSDTLWAQHENIRSSHTWDEWKNG